MRCNVRSNLRILFWVCSAHNLGVPIGTPVHVAGAPESTARAACSPCSTGLACTGMSPTSSTGARRTKKANHRPNTFLSFAVGLLRHCAMLSSSWSMASRGPAGLRTFKRVRRSGSGGTDSHDHQ
jgi:hypothetical protein